MFHEVQFLKFGAQRTSEAHFGTLKTSWYLPTIYKCYIAMKIPTIYKYHIGIRIVSQENILASEIPDDSLKPH
jgi:hypothetical protein